MIGQTHHVNRQLPLIAFPYDYFSCFHQKMSRDDDEANIHRAKIPIAITDFT